MRKPDFSRMLIGALLCGACANTAPALAQGQQAAAYGSDIVVTSSWRDLTTAFPPMSGNNAWVANKGPYPVLVAFTSGAAAPSAGGVVLAAQSAPLYGNATHVWAREVAISGQFPDGGSNISVGLASAAAVSDTTLANLLAANAIAPIPAQAGHGVLIGAVEGTGTAGTPSAYPLSIQGVSGGTPVPVSGSVAFSGTLPAFATTPAVTISGTPTVNVAAMPSVGVTGTFWQTTQPISAAALPLPTGAASDSHLTNVQSAIGTAATAAITVQGSASGVPQPVSGAVTAASNSAGAAALVQSDASAVINVSTATTTQLVALTTGKSIYVTGWDIVVAAADNVTLEYGTGTACATGTTVLTGAYNFAANGGIAVGSGLGVLLKVPAGNALCMVTSAAGQASGRVSYAQF